MGPNPSYKKLSYKLKKIRQTKAAKIGGRKNSGWKREMEWQALLFFPLKLIKGKS